MSMYTLLESLGKGAFGEVFKGKNNTNGSLVALKRIERSKFKESEVLLLKKCDSKYIIKLFNYFPEKNYYWLVLEYCSSGSAQSLKFKCDEKLLNKISFDVLSGLNYLHARHIIHRDVKPANIFIEKGIYKLGDFGISKDIQQNSATSFVGTPDYQAPEIRGTGAKYDSKVDIWSFGITLRMLSKDISYYLAEHCCVRDPKKRPSAEDLLREYQMDQETKLDALSNQIKKLKYNYQRLELELNNKTLQINELKHNYQPLELVLNNKKQESKDQLDSQSIKFKYPSTLKKVVVFKGQPGLYVPLHSCHLVDEDGFIFRGSKELKNKIKDPFVVICIKKNYVSEQYFIVNLDKTLKQLLNDLNISNSVQRFYVTLEPPVFANIHEFSDVKRKNWHIRDLNLFGKLVFNGFFDHDYHGHLNITLREYLKEFQMIFIYKFNKEDNFNSYLAKCMNEPGLITFTYYIK
eukprot:317145_1